MKIERGNLRKAQEIIDANEAADLRSPAREALRKKRGDLIQSAAGEEGRAREIDSRIGSDLNFQKANQDADRVLENTKAAAQIAATLPKAGQHSARILSIVEGLVAQNPRDLERRLAALEARVAGRH